MVHVPVIVPQITPEQQREIVRKRETERRMEEGVPEEIAREEAGRIVEEIYGPPPPPPPPTVPTPPPPTEPPIEAKPPIKVVIPEKAPELKPEIEPTPAEPWELLGLTKGEWQHQYVERITERGGPEYIERVSKTSSATARKMAQTVKDYVEGGARSLKKEYGEIQPSIESIAKMEAKMKDKETELKDLEAKMQNLLKKTPRTQDVIEKFEGLQETYGIAYEEYKRLYDKYSVKVSEVNSEISAYEARRRLIEKAGEDYPEYYKIATAPTMLQTFRKWAEIPVWFGAGLILGAGIGAGIATIAPVVAAKVPAIAKFGAAIAAHPTAFKAVTLGAIGGIEALKAKQMYEAGLPIEDIVHQVGKDVAFIAGFGIGFKIGGKPVAKDTVKVRLSDKPKLVSRKVSVVKGKQVMTETWKFKPGKQVYEIPKSLYGKMRIHPGRVFEITTQRPITTAEWMTVSGKRIGERVTGEVQRSVLYAEFPKRVPSRVWWKTLRIKPHKWARDYRVVIRGAPRGISIVREQVFKVPPETVEFIKRYVPRTLEPGVKKLIYRVPPSFKMPAEIPRVPTMTITGMEVGKKAVKISKKIVFDLGVGGGVTRELTKTPLGLPAIAPTPTMVPFPVTAISLSTAGATMGAVGLATIQQTQARHLEASQTLQRFGLQQAKISTRLQAQAWALSQRQAQALAQTQAQIRAQATAQIQKLTLQYPQIAPSIIPTPTLLPVTPAWPRRERKPVVRERRPAWPLWKYQLVKHPLGSIMELLYGHPTKGQKKAKVELPLAFLLPKKKRRRRK